MGKFKNLKVRAKILLAFGIVLALMCVAVAFVVLANFQTLDNVQVIREDISFQNELTEALSSFNKADVQANILYTVLDENANEAFAKHAGEAEQYFQAVIAHINAYSAFEKFRPEIEGAHAQFSEWKAIVEELIVKNNELGEGRKTFSASGAELVESVALFMEYQVRGEVEPAQLSLAHKINDGITAFRIASRTFQYIYI